MRGVQYQGRALTSTSKDVMEDFPLEVRTELRSEGNMALTREGVEGGTSHVRRADVMGRDHYSKEEGSRRFFILHVPTLKQHVLDHSLPCFHFIWTPFMALEFLPCITVQYNSSAAFPKEKITMLFFKASTVPRRVLEYCNQVKQREETKKMAFESIRSQLYFNKKTLLMLKSIVYTNSYFLNKCFFKNKTRQTYLENTSYNKVTLSSS